MSAMFNVDCSQDVIVFPALAVSNVSKRELAVVMVNTGMSCFLIAVSVHAESSVSLGGVEVVFA